MHGEIKHTLVGTRVLEQDNFALLEMQASLLGEEEIGTLNNVLEVRLSLGINERRHVRDVNSLGTKNFGVISR